MVHGLYVSKAHYAHMRDLISSNKTTIYHIANCVVNLHKREINFKVEQF